MTDEDKQIIARAALMGVTFQVMARPSGSLGWSATYDGDRIGLCRKFTLGRAAMFALYRLNVVTEQEFADHERRTAVSSLIDDTDELLQELLNEQQAD
jgi:hypothetical protein